MKIKIKQYLEENAFSLVAIFTSTFTFSLYFGEWIKVSFGLKGTMLIIAVVYVYTGAYIDVLRQTIKSNKDQILLQADKIEKLQKVKRHER